MSDPALGLLMLCLIVVVIMMGFPTAFTLMGLGLFFGYIAFHVPGQAFADNQVFDLMVQRTYGAMTNDVLVSIPLFVLMGYVMERGALVDKMFYSIQLAFRRVPASLAVATLIVCTFWIRGYFVSDGLQIWFPISKQSALHLAFGAAQGRIRAQVDWGRRWVEHPLGFQHHSGLPDTRADSRERWFARSPAGFTLRFPFWLVVGALLAVLSGRWAHRRFRRKPAHVSCDNCGYDLRASRDRCPECGTPISEPTVEETAP